MRCRPVLTLAACLALTFFARADVPSPDSHLGFRPGADFHLASWDQVVGYFRKLDAASDRVVVQELDRTTEGRPFVLAVISSEATIRDLDRYRNRQRLLSHPPADPQAGSLRAILGEGPAKPVVLITCSIHSSETASTHMAMELAHELASRDDAATREILEGAILLLVPSVNPDGVDIVADWYPGTIGKPWEGSGLPRLYHKYAGHDTNRDWYMLNLAETRTLTRLLYREWFPTITYDVHQMGPSGARIFVPPFYDPINPNLDPRLNQSIAMIGSHMAADLARAGRRGVLTHAMYDNWWNGGNRTTPQRHNMVGLLTESASVRLASPMFLDRGDLKGATRGFPNHDPAVNFVDPWPGGWWRLRDIVEDQLICARSVMTLAARYGDHFQEQYLELSRSAIERGRSEPPYAWIVPRDQTDPGRAAELVSILEATGVEVHLTSSELRVGNRAVPPGSWLLPAAQPYRPHLKDMMERQTYPARFGPGGEAEPPYDIAGWTLPLLMGVEAFASDDPKLPTDLRRLETIERPVGRIEGVGQPGSYLVLNTTDDDLRFINRLLAAKVELSMLDTAATTGATRVREGAVQVAASDESRKALASALAGLSSRVVGIPETSFGAPRLRAPKVGLYQPWTPSMDEGWTRLVLEKFEFPYTTLHNADFQSGRLRDRFDAIILPSVGAETLRNGYGRDQTDPAHVGGLDGSGLEALRAFVDAGGTLIALEDSCRYVLAHWKLPVQEILQGVKSSEFYAPGSLLRVVYPAAPKLDPASLPLLAGMPAEGCVFFEKSLAFDVPQTSAALQVFTSYAPTDVLASGWLLGAQKIQGRAAAVDAAVGQGRVVLFGFPPQYRAQSRSTFRLLFNALFRAAH